VSEPINGFTGFKTHENLPVADGPSAKPPAAPIPPLTLSGEMKFNPEKLALLPQADRRWAWVEVNLNAIRHNVMVTKQAIGPGCRLMAVVKADAYGHGAVQVAKTALNSGAEYLGVATIDEAIELREALINAPILVLAEPPNSAVPLFVAYKVMPTVYTPEFAILYGEEADRHQVRAPYHLKVNTGMNRIGVRPDEVVDFVRRVDFHRALDLVGVYTHFATADCMETLDFHIQAKRFVEAIHMLQAAGINPGIVHAANSAATFRYPEVRFDMVRLGLSMYGLHPCTQTRRVVDLHPAMSVHARIVDVRTVGMSEGVSYGLSYRSPGNVMICTLPIGYADGLRRGLSGRIDMILQGQRCRQVGAICMDYSMYEVNMRVYGNKTRITPQIGNEVLLVGREGESAITIEELANALDTVQHEVTIGFANRIARVHT